MVMFTENKLSKHERLKRVLRDSQTEISESSFLLRLLTSASEAYDYIFNNSMALAVMCTESSETQWSIESN